MKTIVYKQNQYNTESSSNVSEPPSNVFKINKNCSGYMKFLKKKKIKFGVMFS